MKILLAVDGSEFGEEALREVVRRPWPAGSEVKVVSVVEPMPAPATNVWNAALGDYYREEMERRRGRALQSVELAALLFNVRADKTIEVTTGILDGQPQQAIVGEAARWGADLIVVGSHGYGFWDRLLLGSVSQAVATRAGCSVEIVRRAETHKEESGPGMRIILATDGSPCAELAAEEAARRPWPPGTEIRIVSAAEPPAIAADPWSARGEFYAETLKAVRLNAHAAVEAAAAKVRANTTEDLKVTTEAPAGSPLEVILEEAEGWGADLIVVGSRGHGRWGRMLLGSVSQAVATHAPCSVEIVKRREPPGGGKE
jgi:nucleotide-binding universal stress UspA family protein